jgi:hypothetical protein
MLPDDQVVTVKITNVPKREVNKELAIDIVKER